MTYLALSFLCNASFSSSNYVPSCLLVYCVWVGGCDLHGLSCFGEEQTIWPFVIVCDSDLNNKPAFHHFIPTIFS